MKPVSLPDIVSYEFRSSFFCTTIIGALLLHIPILSGPISSYYAWKSSRKHARYMKSWKRSGEIYIDSLDPNSQVSKHSSPADLEIIRNNPHAPQLPFYYAVDPPLTQQEIDDMHKEFNSLTKEQQEQVKRALRPFKSK